MLKNYMKVAFRNMRKYSFFSAINIFGMTVGLTACLLIILYIGDELSYDRFHQYADRTYLISLHGKLAGQDVKTASTCPPLSQAMADEIPEVEETLRIARFWGPVIKLKDESYMEDRVYYADANFFDFFSFKLLEGDPATALAEPNTVVLSEEMAEKYFGKESALDKLLVMDDTATFKVTGVAANGPANSHFRYNVLVSSASSRRLQRTVWLNNNIQTYFRLRENASLESVQQGLQHLVTKYVGAELEKFMGITVESMRENGGEYGYVPVKITDIQLHSSITDTPEPTGQIQYVYIFGAVGLLIVVIACINFMNLGTARSAGRAKEVGLRKALGSLRMQLAGQFLAESFLYSTTAVVLSIVICVIVLPAFNTLAGKELAMTALINPWFMAIWIVLILVVGIIAGSYPAFYLTSFRAAEVLKGKVRSGMKSKGIRSTLVILQFGISIFLIIFTVVIYNQLTYMQDRNLGMDKEGVLVLHDTWRVDKNREALRNGMEQQTGVVGTSFTNNDFPGINNTTIFKRVGNEQDYIMGEYYADYKHADVMKLEMKEGRFFSPEFPSDSTAIIINEAAVRQMGITDPLTEKILTNDNNRMIPLHVIGVMKDFNFQSLKEEIRPLAVRLAHWGGSLMIRYEGNPADIVAKAEDLWGEYADNEPFVYTFMDDDYDKLFRAEQRLSHIFTLLCGLGIFVACLGLFALAAFTAEQRTKEIGIRKSMGASVPGLVLLLSKEFAILVLIAFIPGALVGWWAVDQWLAGFAYRIAINPLVFVFSGSLTIVIALLTVSYQSIKAASTNPSYALRYE